MFANENQTKRNHSLVAWALALTAGVCLTAGAWASGRWVVDARISVAQMNEMARQAQKDTSFPIVVNDSVLAELNRYLGTSEGRDFVGRALASLNGLRAGFEEKLGAYSAPEELLAVGLVESGYQNLPQSSHPAHSAGIWQFIPQTARNFGLRVDEKVDERLNVEKETDVAFRYLAANHLRFNDWLLSVMAYNSGEAAVSRAIEKMGTRDPWELARQGVEMDTHYLARFMAAVLILKNPQVMK